MADDAPLKAFKLAHAVFCYRRKLFYLAHKLPTLAIKPKSLACNPFQLVHEVFCYRRNHFYLARKPAEPGH